MNGPTPVLPAHLARTAIVYLRQSNPAQVAQHRESTHRQYALASRAEALGWPPERILVIDADLGVSGAGLAERDGFRRLMEEVAAGRVGLVLAFDASRLARNGGDWYHFLEACAATDTLVGDADGIYRPTSFNDRIQLAHKGLFSEIERHWLRARLDGGIRNKAARGALRWRLPVGLVWGERGEICVDPDPQVVAAIRTVFDRYARFGAARHVWLSFRSEGRLFPQTAADARIRWVAPGYAAIRSVLRNPAYAGAYAYGRRRREIYVDTQGRLRQRVRWLPRQEWAVLIQNHHQGFIEWPTWEANQAMLADRSRRPPLAAAGDNRAVAARRRAECHPGIARPQGRRMPTRTDAATVALVRRLAADYSDGFIAAMLDREERRTPYGHRFTAKRVANLRRHWRIPAYPRPTPTGRGDQPRKDSLRVDEH